MKTTHERLTRQPASSTFFAKHLVKLAHQFHQNAFSSALKRAEDLLLINVTINYRLPPLTSRPPTRSPTRRSRPRRGILQRNQAAGFEGRNDIVELTSRQRRKSVIPSAQRHVGRKDMLDRRLISSESRSRTFAGCTRHGIVFLLPGLGAIFAIECDEGAECCFLL